MCKKCCDLRQLIWPGHRCYFYFYLLLLHRHFTHCANTKHLINLNYSLPRDILTLCTLWGQAPKKALFYSANNAAQMHVFNHVFLVNANIFFFLIDAPTLQPRLSVKNLCPSPNWDHPNDITTVLYSVLTKLIHSPKNIYTTVKSTQFMQPQIAGNYSCNVTTTSHFYIW